MNLTIAAIVLAVAVAVGGWSGYKLTRLHYEGVIVAADKKAAADLAAADQRAENAASDWEVWASLQRPKTVTITREVEHAIKDDIDCGARALPDQLRDALTKAGHADDPGVAAPILPASSAAGIGDLWGRASRLFGSADRAGGVQGASSSPR